MSRLLDMIARLRRPPMALPWGFRSCDYTFGSAIDRRVQARLQRRAELMRAIEHASTMARAMARAHRRLGVSAAKAVEQMAQALRAWGRSITQATDATLMPEHERAERTKPRA